MIFKAMYLLLLLRVIPAVIGQTMSASVKQDLMTPMKELGEGCGYEGCPFVKEGMLNVHIVPHSHGELGFTKTFYQHYTGIDDYYEKSQVNWKRILDFTISELWDNEHRRFTLSDMPYLFHWWSNRDGTVHRMVYQLIRQGRLHIVGGGWGMPDESCTSYHALIDLFTHSFRKLNKTFGPCGRPLVAWQADVLGHSREFASLAAMFAFDGLFINPISFEDELDRMHKKELEMLWRGSDDLGPDSDIFTHKLFDGYWSPPGFCFSSFCNDSLIITSDSQFKNVEERVAAFIDSVKNRQGYHYATSNIMVMMGTRDGYFDATMWFSNIDSLIEKVNEKSYRSGDNVNLMYSAPACYLKAVFDSSPGLPIKQDDFMPITFDKKTHLTGLYTSRPTIKFMAREGHVFLQIAKQMHVLAALPAKDAKLYDELAWVMGVFQDHNIITGGMRIHVKEYYTIKMYHAVQKSTLLLKRAFNKLRKSPATTTYYRCAFNVSSCRNTNALRSFVVVYNPLAWPVTVPVRVPVVRHERHTVFNPKLQTVRAVSMKMSAAVLSIPRRDTSADHEIVFMAENLPPMGYRSYYIESSTIARQKKKRRSIIKKLPKNQKTYLSRQTDQMKIDDESMLNAEDNEFAEDGGEDVHFNRPLFSIPKSGRRFMSELSADNEAEEKKHRGLFGNANPIDDEEDSWVLTDIPPTTTEEENYRGYDESPKLTTEQEEYTTNHYNSTTEKEEDRTIFPNKPTRKDTWKLYAKPMGIFQKQIHSNKRVQPFLKQRRKQFHKDPISGTNLTFGTLYDNNPHYKATTKNQPNKNDPFESIRKELHDSNIKHKYKLARSNTSIVEDGFIFVSTEKYTLGYTNRERIASSGTHPGLKQNSAALLHNRDGTTSKKEDPDRLTTRKEDSKTLKRFTDDFEFEAVATAATMAKTYPYDDSGSKTFGTGITARPDEPEYPEESESGFFRRPATKTEEIKKVDAEDEGDRPLFEKSHRRMMVTRATPKSTVKTTTEYDPLDDPDFDEDRNYFYKASHDKFIKNKYVKVHLDNNNAVTRVTLSNGVEVALTISLYYYASDDPVNMGRPEDRKPGPYVFKVMDNEPILIRENVRSAVHKSYLVEEVQYSLASWAGFVLRVYVERPLIELDWVVGPVPTADNIGKDVFIRYATDLATGGVFYTDSNGRQTMKRVRNSRPTFQPVLNNIPSNYYPVTSKIHIEDPRKNIRFSVLNDRSQGGTSLHDGQLDLMIHRRVLTDDDGIQAFLNETEYGQGIVVRGKHIIYISKADYKQNKIFEKKLAKEIELAPQVFAGPHKAYGENSKEIWYNQHNEFRGVVNKLPVGIHVLTLQEWNDSLLLRLENYLEIGDAVKSGVKTVFIRDLFANIKIIDVRETTLGGNVWMKDWIPMQWNARDKFVKNFNEFYNGNGTVEYSTEDAREHAEANITKGITLIPQQIRTFVVSYKTRS